MFDTMKYCEINDIPAWILSIDFKKAFDTVEIPSLLGALEFFEFPEYIVNWFRILYSGFTVKIQNNGNFSGKYLYQ